MQVEVVESTTGKTTTQRKVAASLFIFDHFFVITKENVVAATYSLQFINSSTRQNILYLDCKRDWRKNSFEGSLIFKEESEAIKAHSFLVSRRDLIIQSKTEVLDKYFKK
jgi:hypothetical protein